MARGRKPKPAEVRRREGNPGHRPIPETLVLGATPDLEEPPEHLDEDGKVWWREAVPILKAVGILEAVDAPALEMAATAYSRFRQAKRVIDAQGVMSRGAAGQIVRHPALAAEESAQAQYLRFAEQYALTPVARTRLGLAELHRRSLAQEMNDAIGKPELSPA